MYSVTWLDEWGAEHHTQIIATEDEIRRQFEDEGKTIVDLKKRVGFLQGTKVKQKEVIAVFSALGSALSVGKQIPEALTALIDSIRDPKSPLIPVLINIRDKNSLGVPLSKCLDEYVNVFGLTPVAMIAAGEESSQLPQALKAVAKTQAEVAVINKEMWAMIRPQLATLGIAMISMLGTSIFAFPILTKGQEGAHQSVSVSIVRHMSVVFPVFFAILAVTIAAAVVLYKNNQQEAEKYLVRIPLVSEFFFYRGYWHTFTSLSNLLSSGYMLQNAIPIVIRQTKLVTIRQELEEAARLIENGQFKRFGEAFKGISMLERLMLEISEHHTDVQMRLQEVGARFYELYTDKMKIVGPLVKAFIYSIIVTFILLLGSALVISNFNSMSQAGN